MMAERNVPKLLGAAFLSGGLLWYYLFLKSGYIPRVIPLWGLMAVTLALAAATLDLCGYAVPLWVSIPVAPFELAIGFWLLFKGVTGRSGTWKALPEAAM